MCYYFAQLICQKFVPLQSRNLKYFVKKNTKNLCRFIAHFLIRSFVFVTPQRFILILGGRLKIRQAEARDVAHMGNALPIWALPPARGYAHFRFPVFFPVFFEKDRRNFFLPRRFRPEKTAL